MFGDKKSKKYGDDNRKNKEKFDLKKLKLVHKIIKINLKNG